MAHEFEHTYQEALAKLNPAQRRAVEATQGPVAVVAGPGTGKTQVLATRIAHILHSTDTPPEAILALTFTEKATHAMRARLATLVGSTAYRVRMFTFHGFANDILRNNPDIFLNALDGSPLTDSEAYKLIEEFVEQPTITALRPPGRPHLYVKAILGAIGDCKGSALSPEELTRRIEQHREDVDTELAGLRQQEFALVYAQYEAYLQSHGLYDFADMLGVVSRAIEHDASLRAQLQETYLYILVDEHQDTNATQNAIIQLIADPSQQPNIFVVGDVEQAIFRFQGANPANFQNFTRIYPGAQTIRLDTNYRSTQTILDAAATIRPNQGALLSVAPSSAPINLYECATPPMQYWLATLLIREARQRSTALSDIAVIFRTNSEADRMIEHLAAHDIPYAVASDQNALEHVFAGKLRAIAKAALYPGDPTILLPALYIDILGLNPAHVHMLWMWCRTHRTPLAQALASTQALTNAGITETEPFLQLAQRLNMIATAARNQLAPQGLAVLVECIGATPYATRQHPPEQYIGVLHGLFDLARSLSERNKHITLEQFLDELDRIERNRGSISHAHQSLSDAVQLMTVHKAKGLEFDTVIVLNMHQSHWDTEGRAGARLLPRQLEEELWKDRSHTREDTQRLLYVALTRAKQHIALLWPRQSNDGKQLQLLDSVASIDSSHTHRVAMEAYETAYSASDSSFGFAPTTPHASLASYSASVALSQPLTVTALNNYLQCSWKYLFLNVLRIPEAPSAMGSYGTAAHAAVRAYIDSLTKESPMSCPAMIDVFERSLAAAPISEQEITSLTAKGAGALEGWFSELGSKITKGTKAEVSIEDVSFSTHLTLTGKIDAVIMANTWDNASPIDVEVVDFKTKTPMSQNAIMGKTKNDTGNEFRQLVFYRILLDSWRDGVWRMKTGVIEFLEPNTSGKYKREVFAITQEHRDELAKTISFLEAKLLDASFLDNSCNDAECKYCAMAKTL